MYERAMGNCVLTTIAGHPGAGKSYLIAHLADRMLNLDDPPGIPVIVRLRGRRYSPLDLLKEVMASPLVAKKFNQLGVDSQVGEAFSKPTLFRNLVRSVREANQTTVFTLFYDNVDEYVRSVGLLNAKEMDCSDKEGYRQAMLGLIRAINAIHDSVGSGVCSVLSLTVDMVDRFSLGRLDDQENLIAGLTDEDRSLKGRYFPIHEGPDSAELLTFGSMDLPGAYEMVSRNLETWFSRHPNIARKNFVDCRANGWNLYPFTRDAIELLWRASGFPGEIIFGCLSSVNRLLEIKREVKERGIGSEEASPNLVSRPVVATSVLQMSRYFTNIVEGLLSRDELVRIVEEDPVLQVAYLLPQETSRIRLIEGDIQTRLPEALDGLLVRLAGDRWKPMYTVPTFSRTRAHVSFPDFPLIDLVGSFDGRLFGFQFLVEGSRQLNWSKMATGGSAIRAHGSSIENWPDQLHGVVFVCVEDAAAVPGISAREGALAYIDSPDSPFVSLQGHDYRPRVALATVSEEIAWYWKTLTESELFSDDSKVFLSILLEEVRTDTWTFAEEVFREEKIQRWNDLLSLLNGQTDIPRETLTEPPPDRGGWER